MYLGWILWQLLSFYINYFLKLREQCSWEYNNMLRWIMIWDYHLTQDCTHTIISHPRSYFCMCNTNLQPAANCQPEACAPDQWRDGWRNHQRTISSEALFGEDCEASFCMALTLLAVQVSKKNPTNMSLSKHVHVYMFWTEHAMLFCHWLAMTANGVCLHLLVPPLAKCCLFSASCLNIKNSGPILITSWSHEKRYQALWAYTCSRSGEAWEQGYQSPLASFPGLPRFLFFGLRSV